MIDSNSKEGGAGDDTRVEAGAVSEAAGKTPLFGALQPAIAMNKNRPIGPNRSVTTES